MALPTLSYSISRPYPFRWLTPVAAVGGLVLTVLFSLLNFALNGFELTPYAFDQPPTLHRKWYQHFSALSTDALHANCSSVEFPIDSEFRTNQSGLTYTLPAVWTEDEGGNTYIDPTLSYYNEHFQNCSITELQIEVESLDRRVQQIDTATWGLTAWAYVTCDLETRSSANTTRVNLTTSYDAVPPAYVNLHAGRPFEFANPDAHRKASLWWGESLLSAWWVNCSATLVNTQGNVQGAPNDTWTTKDINFPFRKGLFQWYPTQDEPDILDVNFFDINYNLLVDTGGGYFYYQYQSPPHGSTEVTIQTASSNVSNGTTLLFGLDRMARSLYSTVMIDLGQRHHPNSSNVLLDERALTIYTSGVAWNTSYLFVNIKAGPAESDYEKLKGQTGSLGTTASIIATKYTCQIPTQKPGGSLFLSILVADLVFLQASWKFFTLAIGLFMRDRKHEYCEGCLQRLDEGSDLQLDTLKAPLLAKPHTT